MNEEVLLQLIALIYDSVSNPEIWTTALEGIQNAIKRFLVFYHISTGKESCSNLLNRNFSDFRLL